MFALQPEMKVFSGTANRELAERICKYIGVPLGKATISSFPDGETYVMIEENVRGRDVFLIQPTSPPSNEHLMELLIMLDAARRARALNSVFWIRPPGPQGQTAGADHGQADRESSLRRWGKPGPDHGLAR